VRDSRTAAPQPDWLERKGSGKAITSRANPLIFCQTAICGPTLDTVKAVARDYPDLTFINVEPYKMVMTDGRLQPELDASGQLQAASWTDAWGLRSEPWVFVVGADGTMAAKFEGTLGADELRAALDALPPSPASSVAASPSSGTGDATGIVIAVDQTSVTTVRSFTLRTSDGQELVFAVGTLPVTAIRLLLGLIAVTFALNRWFGLSERIARRLSANEHVPGPAAGVFWGSLSGFTSTLAHAGGPPFAVYVLSQQLDKTRVVATSVVFFLVVNYVKLVPYAYLGQLNRMNLAASLLFAPLAPLGIWLGVWLHRRVSEGVFYQVSYTLLFATGLKLIADAVLR